LRIACPGIAEGDAGSDFGLRIGEGATELDDPERNWERGVVREARSLQ
jgi:hypothetical protein